MCILIVLTRIDSESYVAFASRLKGLLNYYLESRRVGDFDGLFELLICDRINQMALALQEFSVTFKYRALFYLLMMPAARLICQRPSSNFPYFRTLLANFLLTCPNSVEYGNSKTTTLLPSAKCTRPLFQGRTGCGGRPSGWHDVVTCQRLV